MLSMNNLDDRTPMTVFLLGHALRASEKLRRLRSAPPEPDPTPAARSDLAQLASRRLRFWDLVPAEDGWTTQLVTSAGRYGFAFRTPSGLGWFRISDRGFEEVPAPDAPWQPWDVDQVSPLAALEALSLRAQLNRIADQVNEIKWDDDFVDLANAFWRDNDIKRSGEDSVALDLELRQWNKTRLR